MICGPRNISSPSSPGPSVPGDRVDDLAFGVRQDDSDRVQRRVLVVRGRGGDGRSGFGHPVGLEYSEADAPCAGRRGLGVERRGG